MAVEYCRPKCIEALLTYQDINKQMKDEEGGTPLQIAELLIEVASNKKYINYKKQYEDIVVLLEGNSLDNIDVLSDPLDEEESPQHPPLIHTAVENNDPDTLSHIIAHSLISVNARNFCRDTPLHCAVLQDKAECVRQLLAAQEVDANAQNKTGHTRCTLL